MYALTIDDHGADTLTLHDSPAAARAALGIYLDLADYDSRPTQLHHCRRTYELLTPDQDFRVVGVATIEPYTQLDLALCPAPLSRSRNVRNVIPRREDDLYETR